MINLNYIVIILLSFLYLSLSATNYVKEPFHNLHRSKIEQHYRFTMDDYPYGFATHPPTDHAIRRENLRNKILDKYNLYVKENPFDKKALIQYRCRPSITGEYTDCGPFAKNTCNLPSNIIRKI